MASIDFGLRDVSEHVNDEAANEIPSKILTVDSDNDDIDDDEEEDNQENKITDDNQFHDIVNKNTIKRHPLEEANILWPPTFRNYSTYQPIQDDTSLENFFKEHHKIMIRSITWNLCAKPPPYISDMMNSSIFGFDKFHLFVIGTEECERSIAQSAIITSKKSWETYLIELLGSSYKPIRSHTLQAIHLICFAHRSIASYIHEIRSTAVATGIQNTLGNKGGVTIYMKIKETSFAFTNAHFTAGQKAISLRNKNFHTIDNQVPKKLNRISIRSSLRSTKGPPPLPTTTITTTATTAISNHTIVTDNNHYNNINDNDNDTNNNNNNNNNNSNTELKIENNVSNNNSNNSNNIRSSSIMTEPASIYDSSPAPSPNKMKSRRWSRWYNDFDITKISNGSMMDNDHPSSSSTNPIEVLNGSPSRPSFFGSLLPSRSFSNVETTYNSNIDETNGYTAMNALNGGVGVGVGGLEQLADRVIFMGDLNYRVACDRAMVMKLLEMKMYDVLRNKDQLSISRERGDVFQHFTEAPLNFFPTYKYDVGTDNYDTGKKMRIPSWTDRILYINKGLECIEYDCDMSIQTSDHKPVYATFIADIQMTTTTSTTTTACLSNANSRISFYDEKDQYSSSSSHPRHHPLMDPMDNEEEIQSNIDIHTNLTTATATTTDYGHYERDGEEEDDISMISSLPPNNDTPKEYKTDSVVVVDILVNETSNESRIIMTNRDSSDCNRDSNRDHDSNIAAPKTIQVGRKVTERAIIMHDDDDNNNKKYDRINESKNNEYISENNVDSQKKSSVLSNQISSIDGTYNNKSSSKNNISHTCTLSSSSSSSNKETHPPNTRNQSSSSMIIDMTKDTSLSPNPSNSSIQLTTHITSSETKNDLQHIKDTNVNSNNNNNNNNTKDEPLWLRRRSIQVQDAQELELLMNAEKKSDEANIPQFSSESQVCSIM